MLGGDGGRCGVRRVQGGARVSRAARGLSPPFAVPGPAATTGGGGHDLSFGRGRDGSCATRRLQGAFESTQSMCTSTAGPLVAKLNDAVVRLVPIPTPQELRARYG